MKTLGLVVAMVLASAAVAEAQYSATPAAPAKAPEGAPTLSMVKRSADGKTLEVVRIISEMAPQTYTVQVPATVTEEVDGEVQTKTVQTTRQQTRMVAVSKMVCVPCAMETLEVRTVAGTKHKPEDFAALFSEEFAPVILLERNVTVVDGKPVTRINRFDKSYLKLFRPDTLLVIMPPPSLPIPTGEAPPPVLSAPPPIVAPSPTPSLSPPPVAPAVPAEGTPRE